eukprot:874894-Prymnesium_polylepis.1
MLVDHVALYCPPLWRIRGKLRSSVLNEELDMLALLPALAASLGPLNASELLGARLVVSSTGLSALASSALPYIVSKLPSSVSVDSISFDQDGFKGKVKNIVCGSIAVGGLDLAAELSGLDIGVESVSLKCTADWNYELAVWPHTPSGSGTVTVKIGGDSGLSAVAMVSSPANSTVVAVGSCKATIDITSLHFDGGLS